MEKVVLASLESVMVDWAGYTSYVFKCLEKTKKDEKYIMCKRFPYWDAKELHVGDKGFVKVRYVTEGDEYFAGNETKQYKCTDIHFLQFVPYNDEIKKRDSNAKVGVKMSSNTKKVNRKTKKKYNETREDDGDNA